MGVRVIAAETAVEVPLTKITAEIAAAGRVSRGSNGFVLDGRLNDAFRAVNQLLDRNVRVRRVDSPGGTGLHAGDFIVAEATDEVVGEVARETGVDFNALNTAITQGTHAVNRLRIGMYQRYYGGNMDEGWTRLLLESFEFPYTTLMDADITAGNLKSRYDVIILPADGLSSMTGDRGQGGGRGGAADAYPPEYRSGFGDEGVDALETFVEDGGTLLTFAEAAALPIERFGLPLRDVTEGRPSTEFWSPGSSLRMHFDNTHPLAYGMPANGTGTFLARNQAWEIVTGPHTENVRVIARFVDRDLLENGWLIGEDLIAKKAAVVSVEHGAGRVVMIGFRAQHRAQTHGTFKLVFNALLGGAQPVAADRVP